MADKMTEVLEQYGVITASIVRGRGAFFCREQDKLYKLEPFEGSEGRLLREYEVKERLYQAGFQNIDRYIKIVELPDAEPVRNNHLQKCEENGYSWGQAELLSSEISVSDRLIAADRYRNPYVLKQYFDGHECDLKNEQEVILAIKNLSRLHTVGRKIAESCREELHSRALETIARHNRELKRVRSFITKQNHKNEFEMKYLSLFSYFYAKALQAEQMLKETEAYNNPQRMGLCHGAYHQHNVLILKQGVATVHFEHFHYDNQLSDFYYFTRKLLEKNHFQYSCFLNALRAYDEDTALNDKDYVYLYLLFSYPEKFWKLSNHYINGNKAWIPPKTLEKLENLMKAEEEKNTFLERFKEEYGIHIQQKSMI